MVAVLSNHIIICKGKLATVEEPQFLELSEPGSIDFCGLMFWSCAPLTDSIILQVLASEHTL